MGNKDQRTLMQDDVKTALRKRDEQNASLEARIDAYIARTAETQARLLKTIDILNSLKVQHAIDLMAKEHEKEILRKEVERWKTFAKVCEVERDDLRDVVEDLIQKVEMSSDFSMLHCSRMNITKHLHELPEKIFESNDTRNSEDILDYGASIITRLRTELDHERKTHCKAVEEANLRISELEAQVAAREARLEASIRHHPKREKSPLDRSSQPRNSDNDIPPPKTMTDEECLRVLADNHARNKSLEIEIRSLTRKLDRVRGTADSPPFIPADVASIGPSSPPRTTSPTSLHPRVTPRQPPITYETDTPLRSPLIPLSTMPVDSPVAMQITLDRDTVSPTFGSQLSIAQLDGQINTCAAQLEVFKAERKMLVEVAVRDRRALYEGAPPSFPQILVIEEECVRLTSHVSQLELELECSRSTAKSREQELLKEINSLKATLHQQSPSLYHPHDARHLEDDIDTEENMDLATPLQPTTILSWNDLSLTPLQNDPLLVPLPFSPERNSSPIIPPSRPITRPSSPHPVKLRRLEERVGSC
ncbi:hypothetical protein K503DRAFT_767910 [Rhizopogon vinicolor AM-OR11-026]|uniref:Uncharacterized protein n=1 Tax=Rhizopogon vinicolor AM-OR11-026 TaxID=1314800 RepID=A0A1B7N8M4_9AGAM|nr:hypothetical protein K503DRAFT_767910 [Rhizopogon vinicolor AM-OR11-026]